ncbi:C-type lectin domain family 1 member B-like [Neocloeon triangulifer]|uniref:C-type lectin domain family 1 member B-like n=1 Tax=Neocloeon triangulifer TaxID=2078957 RepID=UPI00286EDC4C|nr:C-type lectin domain family 1 member B-like [Neocloeon triangulifer]
MARLIWLILLLITAVLAANECSTKLEESEFQLEMLHNFNKTNEKLDRLMRIVFDQVVETRKVAEVQKEELNKFSNETKERFDQLAEIVDQRLNQTMERVEEVANENEQLVKNVNRRLDNLENQIDQTLEYLKPQNQQLNEAFNVKSVEIESSSVPAKCSQALSLKTLSNGKRYHFNKTSVTWAGANEFCTKMGLHMATYTDMTDVDAVLEEDKKTYGGKAWWVSVKNQGIGSEKDFRWRDGTKLELDSPLWEENMDKKEDCAYTNNYAEGKLISFQCSGFSYALCELPKECY